VNQHTFFSDQLTQFTHIQQSTDTVNDTFSPTTSFREAIRIFTFTSSQNKIVITI